MAGDAGDGGTVGSGLRLQGLSEGWGGEDEVCEKSKTPPHFINPQGQPKGLFPQISLL